MQIAMPALKRDEIVALNLRALYEQQGYTLYRVGSFEEYDFYMQNKSFLMGSDIITFTGADGQLMALKPDVTLSIVKSTRPGETHRVYYNEQVFRRSRQTGEYREISQMGVEYIGEVGAEQQAQVLILAAQSLAAAGEYRLGVSHMEFIEAMLAPFGLGSEREAARVALQQKSSHGMLQAAQMVGLPAQTCDKLAQLAVLSGDFKPTFAVARQLATDVPGTAAALQELEGLYTALAVAGSTQNLQLDFSILNDVDYYNGLIFQGYLQGIPRAVLTGGRYDNLLRRFGKPQGAVGFAIQLDELARPAPQQPASNAPVDEYLNVALPKGRMGNKVYKLFAQSGYSCEGVLGDSRKLVFEDATNKVRYFLVKPSDVDIYVEHGAADIGVAGRDVLLESGADVLELLDLHLGTCRLAVAGRKNFVEDPTRPLRVATKYTQVARRYYAAQSKAVEIINLHGSIELAPILGLADVIVDIVETGTTLVENDLAVLAEIEPSSARLIANRAAWRFKQDTIRRLAASLEELV